MGSSVWTILGARGHELFLCEMNFWRGGRGVTELWLLVGKFSGHFVEFLGQFEAFLAVHGGGDGH